MNLSRECTDTDKDALVSYLYGESDAAEHERIEAHVARCPDCRVEIEALQSVRGELAAWVPPERSPGFHLRLVPEDRPVEAPAPPPAWRSWGLAAAAVLVMAASAAVANVQVRYGRDGLTVTTGWATGAAQPASARSEGSAPWRAELAALEGRLRRDLTPAAAMTPGATRAASAGRSDSDLLRRVRSLVEEGETRLQRELALRVTELMREVDQQRRTDLLRIQQGLGQLEGQTGAEAARQREVLNYLVRVSASQRQ